VPIGPGTELHQLQAQANARGLSASMKFTGALYDDDLRTTLPQRTWARHRIRRTLFNYKLTMIKILEYMAGLPVVYDLEGPRKTDAI
jgi:hypothetical protein